MSIEAVAHNAIQSNQFGVLFIAAGTFDLTDARLSSVPLEMSENPFKPYFEEEFKVI